MNCPRCNSQSILRSHATVACLACGHVLTEPVREAWDIVPPVPGGGSHLGPAVTVEERAMWGKPRLP